jgi:hypothetical protein
LRIFHSNKKVVRVNPDHGLAVGNQRNVDNAAACSGETGAPAEASFCSCIKERSFKNSDFIFKVVRLCIFLTEVLCISIMPKTIKIMQKENQIFATLKI